MLPTPEALEAAAARLEREAPGYLAQVRRRAAALARPASVAEQARLAVETATESAPIGLDPPVASQRPAGRALKRAVATAVRFYFLHFGRQVIDFAEASSWMGRALYDYTAGLEAEVADLRERVRCLEERLGAP